MNRMEEAALEFQRLKFRNLLSELNINKTPQETSLQELKEVVGAYMSSAPGQGTSDVEENLRELKSLLM